MSKSERKENVYEEIERLAGIINDAIVDGDGISETKTVAAAFIQMCDQEIRCLCTEAELALNYSKLVSELVSRGDIDPYYVVRLYEGIVNYLEDDEAVEEPKSNGDAKWDLELLQEGLWEFFDAFSVYERSSTAEKNLTTRAVNILEVMGINNVGQLVQVSYQEISAQERCGDKVLQWITDALDARGLSLGMKLPPSVLDVVGRPASWKT